MKIHQQDIPKDSDRGRHPLVNLVICERGTEDINDITESVTISTASYKEVKIICPYFLISIGSERL